MDTEAERTGPNEIPTQALYRVFVGAAYGIALFLVVLWLLPDDAPPFAKEVAAAVIFGVALFPGVRAMTPAVVSSRSLAVRFVGAEVLGWLVWLVAVALVALVALVWG